MESNPFRSELPGLPRDHRARRNITLRGAPALRDPENAAIPPRRISILPLSWRVARLDTICGKGKRHDFHLLSFVD